MKENDNVYLHINNGGIRFEIKEQDIESENERTVLVIKSGHFGVQTSRMEIPLTREVLTGLATFFDAQRDRILYQKGYNPIDPVRVTLEGVSWETEGYELVQPILPEKTPFDEHLYKDLSEWVAKAEQLSQSGHRLVSYDCMERKWIGFLDKTEKTYHYVSLLTVKEHPKDKRPRWIGSPGERADWFDGADCVG